MSSRNKNKAALYHKLEKLRSASNSSSVNQASIVVDASRYIQELKERVETLNQDVASLPNSTQVKVETLEKGFLINVLSDKNCPGLLVSILEAFEELGLEVLDARVSCSHQFRLEAVSENEGPSDSIDAQVVKRAVLQAIRNSNDEQQD
ncbi:transcription factor bHLH61-like isoform X1 [Salvia hispanica]|uniref:transcription factor bHLH61-like isoform X1 n=1 Tax=Salvia hispanica TaxID=49212 RepID=UPI002009CF1B|nr:transcription factor bHLH61-like isoform X1 [Salvia hispanica]